MQTSLFTASGSPDYFEDHDLHGATIRDYPQAFTPVDADHLLTALINQIPWQQGSLRIAGKLIRIPRLQCWMGDRKSLYGYSGITLKPAPWQEPVLAIRQRVQTLTGVEFNSVLLNYYRNGQDSVAWHADDETELGSDPLIASVSLGAERPFQLKPKPQSRGDKHRIVLRHGSILLMGKGLQINWLHQLPKVKDLDRPRINLTFRQIL